MTRRQMIALAAAAPFAAAADNPLPVKLGIDLFSLSLPPFTLAPGDSLTVTGSIVQFRGLTELQPEFALLQRHATGQPIPANNQVRSATHKLALKLSGVDEAVKRGSWMSRLLRSS